MQFGLGVFVGAGASIEGGYSKPLTTGRSQSWGFFFNGGIKESVVFPFPFYSFNYYN
jgi:hypothetical protein